MLVSQWMASVWEKTSATKPRLNIFAIRGLDSLQAPGYDTVSWIKSGVEPCQLVKVIMLGKVIYSKTSQWCARGASRKFHFKAKTICLRIVILVCKIGTPPWTTCRFVLVSWFNKKSIRSTALYFCIEEGVYKEKNKQKMLGLFYEEMVLNCALSYVRHFGKLQTKLAQNISIPNVKWLLKVK